MQNRLMRVGIVSLVTVMMVWAGAAMSDARPGTTAMATPTGDPCADVISATPVSIDSDPAGADLPIVAPFDLTYIDAMVAHVEGSATLAEIAATRAEHEELKDAAQSLATTFREEARRLTALRDLLYPDAPPVPLLQTVSLLDEALAGVGASADAGMGASSPLGAVDDARALCTTVEPFDLEFLDVMTRRFYGDIGLAELAFARAEHPELRAVAKEIGSRRQAGLVQFATWSAEWDVTSAAPTPS